jgi:hypothetical protein
MRQTAYGHLSIPVMSSEIERAFSGAKLNPPGQRVESAVEIIWTIRLGRNFLIHHDEDRVSAVVM